MAGAEEFPAHARERRFNTYAPTRAEDAPRYHKTSEDEYYNWTGFTEKDPYYSITPSVYSGAIRGEWNAYVPHGEAYAKRTADADFWGTKDHPYVKRACKFSGGKRGDGEVTWYVNRVGPFTGVDLGLWHWWWWQAFDEWEEDFALPGALRKRAAAQILLKKAAGRPSTRAGEESSKIPPLQVPRGLHERVHGPQPAGAGEPPVPLPPLPRVPDGPPVPHRAQVDTFPQDFQFRARSVEIRRR